MFEKESKLTGVFYMTNSYLYHSIYEILLLGNLKQIEHNKGCIERNIRKYLRSKAKPQKINPDEPTMISNRNNLPIKFIPGYIYPRTVGCKACYRTDKGRLIKWHMSWAQRTGWNNINYHKSSVRVEVGDAWFLKHFQKLKGK